MKVNRDFDRTFMSYETIPYDGVTLTVYDNLNDKSDIAGTIYTDCNGNVTQTGNIYPADVVEIVYVETC